MDWGEVRHFPFTRQRPGRWRIPSSVSTGHSAGSLEAHELAFQHFGWAFQRLRYDNLTLAVKKFLRGEGAVVGTPRNVPGRGSGVAEAGTTR